MLSGGKIAQHRTCSTQAKEKGIGKMTNTRQMFLALGLAVASALPVSVATFDRAYAATAEDLTKDADQALKTLYRTNPVAEQISKSARAVLVFPKIIIGQFEQCLSDFQAHPNQGFANQLWGPFDGTRHPGPALALLADSHCLYWLSHSDPS
jgi:hypothetical protein